MLQRIQTVFLLLAVLSLVLIFFIPFATSTEPLGNILADQVFDPFDHTLLAVVIGFDAFFTFLLIFLYKNRSLQIRLSYLSIVLDLFIVGLAIYLFFTYIPAVPAEDVVNHGFGFYLPPLSIIFIALAMRYIRKDQKLVRSMDRLR